MAEVGRRLRSGVYRLSALRISQSRSVCIGGSPGCLLISCAFSDSRVKEESDRDQHEVQSVSKSRATRHRSEKLPRVRKRVSQQEDVALLCATSLGLASSRFVGFVETRESLQAHKTALYLSPGLLQQKMLPCRMISWTRGAVSIHPDTFGSPQQLRTVCTVVFILSEQGSERLGCGQRLRRLKLHPDILETSTTRRSYSSKDPPLLHRSRTAYYDILKVSPNATQSQIKTAYYKQSFIYHPDKNPESKEATQRFAEISEAYTVLRNISLRRRYDRGILSQSDVQSTGRPSSKEATSRSKGSSQQQQQHQQRARQFSQAGGRPMFDFDAFFQAHYGEQLQRVRDMRARKKRMEESQKEMHVRWSQQKMVEVSVMMVLSMAGLIILGFIRP